MQEIATILSQPITQIGGIIGGIALLQKAGIDVAGMVRSWINIRDADTASQTNAVTKNTLETMIFQMSELSNHFNHETTGQLDSVHEKLSDLKDGIKDISRTLQEIKTYGIICRKD